MKRSLAGLVALVASAVVSQFAIAQPLADHVPEDVVFYAGWAGADAVADSYAKSHLKPVIDASKIPDLFGTFLDDAEKKLVAAEPQAKEPMRLIRLFGKAMWKYPSAVYFRDLENWNHPSGPTPRAALMCDAGPDAGRVAAELVRVISSIKQDPNVPIRSFTLGTVVCVSIGYDDAEMALAGDGPTRPQALQNNPAFAAALKETQAGAAVTVYLDLEHVVELVETGLAETKSTNPEQQQTLKRYLDGSGIRGVKRYISTAGFDGKDWVEQTFLDVPAPRMGILAGIGDKPLDDAKLAGVPADATFFAAVNFDPAAFVDALQTTADAIGPEAGDVVAQGLSALNGAAGTNVRDNLLAPLGETWVAYNSPTVNGSGLLGIVVVNPLDDDAKAKAGLTKAAFSISNFAAGLSGPDMTVRGRSTKINGVDVYYFGIPVVAPSWAINDGNLYLGLFPQSIDSAVRHAAKKQPSITTSPKYQALLKRLGVAKPTSVTYFDLPQLTGRTTVYNQMQLVARYAGLADLFGLTLPEPLLPPLDVLIAETDVAGSVSWVDAAGFHTKSVSPFFGANIVASEHGLFSSVGVGSAALGTSILLPSLNRDREAANRIKSGSNMSQIGMAMLLASNESRDGKYPAKFGDLLDQDVTLEIFISPRTNTARPDAAGDMSIEQKKAWLNEGHSDYVYLGAGKTNSVEADVVVAYEKPEGLFDGINVLFGDGHVEFITMEGAARLFNEQKIEQDFPGVIIDGGL